MFNLFNIFCCNLILPLRIYIYIYIYMHVWLNKKKKTRFVYFYHWCFSDFSLLSFPQRFGRYVLRPFSGVYRTLPISPQWTLLTVICTERFRYLRGRSISVLSEQYQTFYLFYVTLSFLCNMICYLISVFAFSLVTVTRLQSGLNLQPPDDCLLRSLGSQRL